MFFIGIVSIFSQIGFGWGLSNILLRHKETNFAWFLGTGLGFTIIIGGVLNLLSIISKTNLIIYLALGILSCLALLIVHTQEVHLFLREVYTLKSHKKLLAGTLVIILICLLRYASSVSVTTFNPHDDYQGYFAFPIKMLQTGELGADPFSERRLVSSLGGQAFLDTVPLAFGSYSNLNFTDSGIAFISFIIVLYGLLRYLNIAKTKMILILLTTALLPAPSVNITALYTALTLFTLTIWFFYKKSHEDNSLTYPEIILYGINIAALCALKNSLAPTCTLMATAFFLYIYSIKTTTHKKLLVHILFFIISSFIFLLPWMISSYNSSGTLYYPLLGKGTHGSVYGNFLTPTSELSFENILNFLFGIQNILFYASGLFLTLIISSKNTLEKNVGRRELYIGLAIAFSFLIISYATAGYSVDRYSFAFIVPGLMILLARTQNNLSILILCLILGSSMQIFFMNEKQTLESLAFGVSGKNILTHEEINLYRNIQYAVPAQEKILARLKKNFVFDFTRNTIYLADYPGASSPYPGMPYKKGPEALATYLYNNKIRYIAYAYKYQANFSKEQFSNRLNPKMNAWIRTEAGNTFDFQDNLDQLGSTRKRIYDDGENFVIDLQQMIH
jgi:hypothetical protein